MVCSTRFDLPGMPDDDKTPPKFTKSMNRTMQIVTQFIPRRYYKNVRKEWASLVATPTSARFQDALAFTRSIGDFHLQVQQLVAPLSPSGNL